MPTVSLSDAKLTSRTSTPLSFMEPPPEFDVAASAAPTSYSRANSDALVDLPAPDEPTSATI